MGKQYQGRIKKIQVQLYLEERQDKYLETQDNKSDFVRWLIDEYEGYQKHIKKLKEGE